MNLNIFKSYLIDRHQRVEINNEFSKWLLVKYFVPQRTVLGPLLFIIYINGLLDQNVDGEILCTADDTAILFSSNCVNDLDIKVNNGINKV